MSKPGGDKHKSSPFLICGPRNHLVDAGDKDVSIDIDELAHQHDEVRHRLVHHPAEHARVKILSWSRDCDLEVSEPAQTIGQTRGASVEPIVIGLRFPTIKIATSA